MSTKLIRDLRNTAIKHIKKDIKPYFYESGLTDKNDNPLQVVAFKYCDYKKIRKPVTQGLQDGFMGFTKQGLIAAAAAGGVVVLPYSHIALEDLIKVANLTGRLKPRSYER